MTKFTMNGESVKRLLTLSNQSKELMSQTKPIFVPSDGALTVNLYSPKSALTFSVDISNFETDEVGLNYFTMPIGDFTGAITAVIGDGSIEIAVNKAENNVDFMSETTGIKISKPISNAIVSDEEAEASTKAVEDLKDAYLQDSIKVTVTPELLDTYDSIAKFMTLAKNSQNTINVVGNKIFYSDNLVILEKTISAPIADRDIFLKKSLLENLKPFIKLTSNIVVELRPDFSVASFESAEIGYKAVLSLEESRYQYPTEEEAAEITPTADCRTVFKTNKKDIQAAFQPFNGTFKASGDTWLWKAVKIKTTKNELDSGKITFAHKDYTGRVESKLPITVVENTENCKEGEIIVSIQVVEELLTLIKDEDITISYNNLTPNEAHGVAIVLQTDSMKAICVKLKPAS